nr:MAG TPA: hypothetical protein [Caudoviricetes sp.]
MILPRNNFSFLVANCRPSLFNRNIFNVIIDLQLKIFYYLIVCKIIMIGRIFSPSTLLL